MLAFQTILHPTDFSASSQLALDVACGLAGEYDAHLVIVHVVPAPMIFSDSPVLSIREPALEDVRSGLNGLDIPEDGIDVGDGIVEGSPAKAILTVAQLCHADLIVMGSHGRRGLRRWFMGSVVEAVMRAATCPVLTISTRGAGRLLGAGGSL
jgi:nucleotide-binding universal stress UspA family protein